MRRLLPAALIATALLLAACGSSSSGGASSGGASSASASASSSPSASTSASESSAPTRPASPDPQKYCEIASNLYAIMKQATSAQQAAQYLAGIASEMRGTSPAELAKATAGFTAELDTIAAGIKQGTIDGPTAGKQIDALVAKQDAADISKFCGPYVKTTSPSASASASASAS